MRRYTRKEYEEELNDIPVSDEDLRSNGGRIPDRMENRYGTWLRRNDPIAFNVSYNEMERQHRETQEMRFAQAADRNHPPRKKP